MGEQDGWSQIGSRGASTEEKQAKKKHKNQRTESEKISTNLFP